MDHVYARHQTFLLGVSRFLVALTVLVLGMAEQGYGQDKVRRYATRQHDFSESLVGLGGRVDNPLNVVDGNPRTASTLAFVLGALGLTYAEQVVDFNPNPDATNANGSPTFPAGTPITVKLSLPSQLLGVLTGVEIQPITNLRRDGLFPTWKRDAVGSIISGASLLSLLSGAGESEITIVPNVPYQGIRVRLTSALGLSGSADFFHAYVMEDAAEPLNCEERDNVIDVLSGTRSTGLDLLTVLGGVVNPYQAVNGNLDEYALMTVGVGALNTVYLNTIFETPSTPGQKLRVVLESPNGLLNLELLSAFTIQPYLRDQPVGLPLEATSPLLSLRLLPGTTKYELAYEMPDVFDRVELRFDNTLAALTSLRVYEVSRSARVMTVEDPTELADLLTDCGEVDLSNAIANYQPDHFVYNYYTVATGGSPLPSSFVSSSGTYYIEAVDPVTGCASARVSVSATITPLPEISLSAISAVCEGDIGASLGFSNVLNGANEYRIEWAGNPEGFENLPYTALPSDGQLWISIPVSAVMGEYHGTLTVRNTETGCESVGHPITVTVLPKPRRAQVSISDAQH